MQETSAKPTANSDEIVNLVSDALILGRYALESGALAEPCMFERLISFQRKLATEALDNTEIMDLLQYYDRIVRSTGRVTADSLRATTAKGNVYWQSKAGQQLVKLWIITALTGFLVFCYAIAEQKVKYLLVLPSSELSELQFLFIQIQDYTTFLVPFTYGALGSCAYLLRVLERKLRSREFDPDRVPEHWNRLVLGSLSGGVIVLFVHQLPGSNELESIKISLGALGFLAGYSIDFLFQTLDRIINAILPKTGLSSTAHRQMQTDKQLLINRYQQKISKTENTDTKKVLTEIVNDLQDSR